MLSGDREQVPFQRYRRPCWAPKLSLAERSRCPLLRVRALRENDIARAVVEDGGPLAAHIQVHRAVAGQVYVQALHVIFHLVEVVAVGFEVDAAVKDVGVVGVAGNRDGEASALGGVDAAGAGAEVEGVLLHVAVFQVYDRHHAGLTVADEQASYEFLGSFLAMFAVFIEDFHEVYWVNGFCHRNYGVVVAGRVVYEFLQPCAFKLESYTEHQVGVGDAGDVLRARLVAVRVGVGGKQGEYVHPVLADNPHPVGDYVTGRHYAEFFSRGCGGCCGWRRSRGRGHGGRRGWCGCRCWGSCRSCDSRR